MSNKNNNQSILEKVVNSSDENQQQKDYSTYVKNVTNL